MCRRIRCHGENTGTSGQPWGSLDGSELAVGASQCGPVFVQLHSVMEAGDIEQTESRTYPGCNLPKQPSKGRRDMGAGRMLHSEC